MYSVIDFMHESLRSGNTIHRMRLGLGLHYLVVHMQFSMNVHRCI